MPADELRIKYKIQLCTINTILNDIFNIATM